MNFSHESRNGAAHETNPGKPAKQYNNTLDSQHTLQDLAYKSYPTHHNHSARDGDWEDDQSQSKINIKASQAYDESIDSQKPLVNDKRRATMKEEFHKLKERA